MNVLLALGSGIGIGFLLGCLFARLDQKQMFGLVTATSDSLVRSALFPGMPKEIFDTPRVQEPAEEMFDTDEDPEKGLPGWLKSDQGPWDTTEVEG